MLLVFAAAVRAADSGFDADCASCHAAKSTLFQSAIARFENSLPADLHFTYGLTCADCHAPHSEANPAGARPGLEACAGCHKAISEAYSNGGHYDAFRELGYNDCSACHKPHGLERLESEITSNSAIEAGDGFCATCHFPGSVHHSRIAEMKTVFQEISKKVKELGREQAGLMSKERLLPPPLRSKAQFGGPPEAMLDEAKAALHGVDGWMEKISLDADIRLAKIKRDSNRAEMLIAAMFVAAATLAVAVAWMYLRAKPR
jgi:hypothetical protein